MKKILLCVPVIALMVGAVAIVGNANGSVSTPVVPEATVASVSAVDSQLSSDPSVVMYNWQETVRKTSGSKSTP